MVVWMLPWRGLIKTPKNPNPTETHARTPLSCRASTGAEWHQEH